MCHFLCGRAQASVDGQADRTVHLLADEPGRSGVGLDRGAGQDPIGGQNLLLGSGSRHLGLLQLPGGDLKQEVSKKVKQQDARKCFYLKFSQ